MAILFLHHVYGTKGDNCYFPECRLRVEGIWNSQLFYRQKTSRLSAEKVVYIRNRNDCWLNTTVLKQRLKTEDGHGVGTISFKCSSNIVVDFTSVETSFHSNFNFSLKVTACRVSLYSYLMIKRTIGNILAFELDDTAISFEQPFCNVTNSIKDICDLWTTMYSIKLTLPSSDYQHNNATLLFDCPGVYPSVTNVLLRNWPIDSYTSSLIDSKFPYLHNLEISFSSLTIPPLFRWYAGNGISQNLTEFKHADNHVLTAGLHKRTLRLNSNNIKDLTKFYFKGNVQSLDLSSNGLHVFNESTFTGLTGLQHLNLRNNTLTRIPNRSWRNLRDLRYLDLKSNKLTKIPNIMFVYNAKIEFLDFSSNYIKTIEENAFTNLMQLREIHLESNELLNLPEKLLPLYSLKFQYIFLDGNPLTKFPISIIHCRSLEKASFRYTNIDLSDINEVIDQMQWSIVSNNVDKSTDEGIEGILTNFPEHLRKIDLSGSRVENIELDIFKNSIYLPRGVYIETEKKVILLMKFFEIILQENKLTCDCRINEFIRLVKHAKGKEFNGKEYFFKWKCSSPNEFKDRLMVNIKESDTYCEKVIQNCPNNCTCLERSVSGIIIVDCRYRGYLSLPEKLPDGIVDIWFQHNNISVVQNMDYLKRIRYLYLSHNQLVEISGDAIQNMNNLRKLHVDSNNLVTLPTEIRDMNIEYININYNPFKCDCHSLWMKHWLVSKSKYFPDITEITCNVADQSEKGRVFITIPDSDFVCLEEYDSLKDGIIPSLTSTGCTLAFILALSVLYVFRFEVKVLIFIYIGLHPFDLDEDNDREAVDVLVVHAPGITTWVMENIVSYLEAQRCQYVVCEIMRDFIPGFSLQENVGSIVKNSKRMILVISPELLEGQIVKLVWSEAQEKIKELRTNYAVIVYHNVTTKEITNKDMLRYLKRGKSVQCNDRLLRQKLFYCMPVFKGCTQDRAQLPNIQSCVKNMYSDVTIRDNQYDRHVFISHSDKETRYMLDNLKPVLEKSGYILCIPDRDFVLGAPKEENILTAIESCHHTIFFLSENHLQDEWSIFTFRTACEKSLRNKNNHLIVIISENININEIDEEVRYHVNTHVTLQIGEEWFVKKLLNSLPDVQPFERCAVNQNIIEGACCLYTDIQNITDSMLFERASGIGDSESIIENDHEVIQNENEERGLGDSSVGIFMEDNIVEQVGRARHKDEEIEMDRDGQLRNFEKIYEHEINFRNITKEYEVRNNIENDEINEFNDTNSVDNNNVCNRGTQTLHLNIQERIDLNVAEDGGNFSDILNEQIDVSIVQSLNIENRGIFNQVNIEMARDERNIFHLKTYCDVSDSDVSDSDNYTDSETDN